MKLRRVAAFAGGEHFTMALAPFGPPQCAPPVPSIRAREAGSAVLSGVVSGAQPLRLQWLRDGVEIPGATNQFLLLKHVTPSAAGSYVLFASNALGRATANPISLTVVPGTQPIGGTAQWRQAPYGRIYAASPSLPPVCSISSGGFHTLALHTDGTVVAWGKNRDGQCNVPITATAIVAVAAGGDHSLALREDGTVVAWGRNWDGQTSVPASASNVIAIAAGWAHSLALRSDGTVVAWGNNEYGQTDVSVIATDLKAISAGYYHSMGLRADGLVMTWGLDYPIPPEATNIVAIKAGWQHCLALRPDGSILAWGDNYHGHCNVPPSATNITAFASAYYCAVALRADGSLLSWGTNRFEYSGTPELSLPAVGLEAQEDTHAVLLSSGPPAFGHHFASVTVRLNGPLTLCPAVVGATDMQFQWLLNGQPVSGATGRCLTISRTAAADAGAYVLVAWNDQGVTFSQAISVTVDSTTAPITRVGGWGDNHRGQLLVPHALTSPRSISARAQHALAVDAEGAIHAWGKNTAGQTNVPPAATNVLFVAAGGDHSLALRTDGAVVAWGGNWDGQCNVPTPLTNAVAIAAGMAHSLALRADGTVLAWGNNAYGQTNVSPLATNVLAIAAGYCHSLALLANHTVVCWGTTLPVPAATTNAVAIAGGLDHSLVLRADGTVIAWGRNDYGQCSVPPSATNVVAVAAGLGRSLALLADGTVLAWGRQFLDLTPMPSGLRDVAAIAAGEDFDLAMVLVGPPVATTAPATATASVGATAILAANCAGSRPLTSQWFHNSAPVLGATNRFLRLANVQSSAAGEYTLVVSNSAGQTASVSTELAIQTAPVLATKPVHKTVLPGAPLCLSAEVHGLPPMTFHWLKDGSVLQDSSTLVGAHSLTLCLSAAAYADTGVYALAVSNAVGGITSRVAQVVVTPVVAWGDDSASQLQIPPQAISLVALASREDHNLALRTDGSVVAWGDNTFGQNLVPPQASNVVAVAEGSSHCLALRADGKVVAWGDNSYGKASVPSEATNVVAIAAGQHLSLALRADGTVVFWGEPYGTSSIPVWATNIVGIAARDLLPYYLRSDGGVITAPASTLVNDGLALASGPAHTLILREDGGLTGFGVNHYGQATAPASALDIVAVAAGGSRSVSRKRRWAITARRCIGPTRATRKSRCPRWRNTSISVPSEK